jgi:hypothetical protein
LFFKGFPWLANFFEKISKNFGTKFWAARC